jgi:uncharacterized protein (TIGR04255 family)
MPFPEAPRVIYRNNPLDRVICQFRFPPILRIDKEVPADFQERIRGDFPGFSEKKEVMLAMPRGIQKEFPPDLLRQMVPNESKNYEFTSEDGIWAVNLTRTFLALTTRKYKRRDDFKTHLKVPLEALVDIYRPAYFSRIGLRYVDIIKRSVLGLEGVNWCELLQPYALGLLSAPDVGNCVQSLECRYEVLLEDNSSVATIIMALVEWHENNNEECFMIDTDFYTTGKTEIADADPKLDYFHVRASRLIQWFITRRLHEAMEPEIL